MKRVLSLFNGMGVAAQAFKALNVPILYHASEVDKYANQINDKNNLGTIHHGDISNWRDWPVINLKIDYVLAGSPCQGFSLAGKQAGTSCILNGVTYPVRTKTEYISFKIRGAEFLSQSHLFWEFALLLEYVHTINPNVKFMLENVKMKKEYTALITKQLTVTPVLINSALVCAQNRQRNYWCNWNVEQPDDRGIYLKDILEIDGTGWIKNHGEYISRNDKSQCLDANYHKGIDNHGQRTVIGYVNDNDRVKGITENERGFRPHRNDSRKTGISELGRLCKSSAKTDSLTTSHMPKVALNDDINNLMYRKLTPIECERLQGMPDNYTDGVSNTQRYKMLGNGWQLDTIIHIIRQSL